MNETPHILKCGFVSIVVAYASNTAANDLKSDFLAKFLEGNLITLLIATLSINAATIGIILSRLGELTMRYKCKFPSIVSAMKTSILEQLILIILAAISLVLKTSKTIQDACPQASFYFVTVLIAIMIYDVIAIYDTANAAFLLNKEIENLPANNDASNRQE